MPQTSPHRIPNYADAFKMNTQPMMDQMKLKVGLTTMNSSDPMIAMRGKAMADEAISSVGQPAQENPSGTESGGATFNWGAGFGALSQVGSRVGGQAGQILSGVGNLGSSIQMVREAGKGVKEGLQGAGMSKAGAVGSVIGAASGIIGSFLPEKTEYAGPKGDITQTMDSVYDGISDAAMAIPGIGTLVGGIMKGGALLGKGMNALGGGTDGMTTTDAILGSSFLNLTPIGLINGFGGKKADTITKDELAFETVGSSYTGSNQAVNDALQKSGKKYGAFSSKARNQANEEIREARRQQQVISTISDEASDRFAIRNSMAAINGNRRAFNMQGGYDQSAIRVGRSGLKLSPVQARTIIQKYQRGGKAGDPFQVYLNSLPQNQRDSTNYRVKDYWSFNGKPKNFEEAKQKGMFTLLEDGWHANSVAENPETGEIEFMKPYNHPTLYKELEWYNSDDGAEFRSQYELVKTQPYFKYVKRKQAVPTHKDGGSIIELVTIPTEIELISIEELPEFQNGGSINVIPDGALHARKHNMDMDGITPKGIPVVSEKDGGEIEQQAEIEKEEIIFRLEVTQKLEELSRKYFDNDSTQKEKDAAALEAGQLLAKEILHNTIDNTNNLL